MLDVQTLEPRTPPLRGTAVTFADGTQLIMPPVTLLQVEELEPELKLLKRPGVHQEKEVWAAQLACFHAAFVRNYPKLTSDMLKELLDVVSAFDCYLAFTGVNALRERLPRLEASP